MRELLQAVRGRLLPAGLTATGVALVTAGLRSYTGPTEAMPLPSPSPVVAGSPSPSPSAPASPSPSGASPSPTVRATATRVAVPALGIDLPVMAGPPGYPPCDVAMYLTVLGQPGEGRGTYLFAHARTGMFLPILEASRVRNGADMKGMIVQVWTSDDRIYLYEITEVRRHQTDLLDAQHADHEQMWLQTSEGPRGTIPKTQIVAEPLSVGPAAPADAHPTPKPVACG